MKYQKCKECFYLLTCIYVFGFSEVSFADATDSADHPRHTNNSVEIEYFSIGNSKSNVGNAQVGTSGVLVQTEYEKDDMVFSFNLERWNYNWKNPESLPFVSGLAGAPWSTFNTLQFGFVYEQEMDELWEFNYYVEAESSFEKETSGSNEYEVGVDVIYEPSK